MCKYNYIKILGEGAHGVAVKILRESHVLKITNDEKEYSIAQQMIGKKNEHLVDIYDCHKLGNTYYIWQEYLQENPDNLNLTCFTETFKQSVADCINEYFPDNGLAFFWAGVEYIKKNNKDFIRCALNEFRKKLCSSVYETMFMDTCKAIQELNRINEKANLDLHGENIGFTTCGKLKYYDLTMEQSVCIGV